MICPKKPLDLTKWDILGAKNAKNKRSVTLCKFLETIGQGFLGGIDERLCKKLTILLPNLF